jgi:hypothetical protein
MTVVFLVTHFFNRKNNYSLLFSTAISEGIKDMFKEMGYSGDRSNKKENARGEPLSANGEAIIERMN